MDIITGTNLKGQPATVFCTSKPRRAVGPVFESKEEAEKFASFLAGLDPAQLAWGHPTDTGEMLLVMWAECGCPAKRPIVQFSFDEDIRHDDDGDKQQWAFSRDLVFDCFPLFLGRYGNNHDITERLIKDKVVAQKDTDAESSCSWYCFESEADARTFIERFNGWLRDNWNKAYP